MGGVDLQKQGGTVFQDTRRRKGKIGDVAAGTFDKDKVLKAADLHNLILESNLDINIDCKEKKQSNISEFLMLSDDD